MKEMKLTLFKQILLIQIIYLIMKMQQLLTLKRRKINKKQTLKRIYKTFKKDPIFINEEGIEEMGKWVIDVKTDYPPKQRDLTVTMRVGGTFIDVKAKHKISGNKINLKFEFN